MAKDAFSTALAGFRQWTKTAPGRLAGDPKHDVDEMQAVVGLMRDYLDIERPAELTPAGLEELLLRVYPRKITVLDAAGMAGTVPAVRDFVTYLAETGELTRPQADELEHSLQAIAPQFAAAVMDPGNWGMARSFLTMMAAEGVDLDDEAAVRRWIADYNTTLGEDEDDDEGPDLDLGAGLKEAFGLPDVLPPVKLPADAELAAAARQAPVVTQLKSLTGWLGDGGREVDEDWELVPGDASAAVNAAGVEPGELPYLWDTAAESDFIYFDEGEDETVRALRGEVAQEWEGYDDAEVLDAWRTLLGITLLRTLDIAAELDPDRARDLNFAGHGGALAVMLFLARAEGIQVSEASDVLRESATAELKPAQAVNTWRAWTDAHGDPLRLLQLRLTGLGAVRLTEDPDEGELMWLTPLGLYAVRAELIEAGVAVPLLPDLEDMTAADLLAMSEGVPEEEFNATSADWIKHRTPEAAARELLAAATEADATRRLLAVAVTTELGAVAELAWRDCLGELSLRGYARGALAALAGHEVPEDLTFEDVAWISTDTLIGTGVADPDAEHDPAELARLLGDVVPRGREELLFEAMARLPHPEVAEVLTVLGKAHPDKKTAKLARKAAYKAVSRQASRAR